MLLLLIGFSVYILFYLLGQISQELRMLRELIDEAVRLYRQQHNNERQQMK